MRLRRVKQLRFLPRREYLQTFRALYPPVWLLNGNETSKASRLVFLWILFYWWRRETCLHAQISGSRQPFYIMQAAATEMPLADFRWSLSCLRWRKFGCYRGVKLLGDSPRYLFHCNRIGRTAISKIVAQKRNINRNIKRKRCNGTNRNFDSKATITMQ